MSPTSDYQQIEILVERYSDMVMRIAYQHTRSRSEAEDIMQDVFVALLKKFPFASNEYEKAWIIRVTINKCKNFLKSARRKNVPLQDYDGATLSDKNDMVMEEILALPETEKNVVYLYYYEGYSAKEVGKILRRSENSVFILLSRARKHLKLLIEENNEN